MVRAVGLGNLRFRELIWIITSNNIETKSDESKRAQVHINKKERKLWLTQVIFENAYWKERIAKGGQEETSRISEVEVEWTRTQ